MTSQKTLTTWAGLPATERVKLFHRRFPDRRISPQRLYKIYKDHKIRRKQIKATKQVDRTDLTKYVEQLQTLRKEVLDAIRAGLPICFQDETFFTKRSFQQVDYSGPRTNISLNYQDAFMMPVCVSAFVCRDKGVLHWKAVASNYTAEELLAQVKVVANKMGNVPFALYLDRLPMHRSNWLRDRLGEMNVTRILGVPTSP